MKFSSMVILGAGIASILIGVALLASLVGLFPVLINVWVSLFVGVFLIGFGAYILHGGNVEIG